MPPEGNDEASGSPVTSSLPQNSSDGPAVAGRLQEAVVLLGGQAGHGLEQCVKWVAPFSMAQSFMAVATASAMAGSSGAPCLMVFCRALKTGLGSRSR